MRVKELIGILKGLPEECEVMLYDTPSEEGGILTSVGMQDITVPAELVYFKGDHPLVYRKDIGNLLVLLNS